MTLNKTEQITGTLITVLVTVLFVLYLIAPLIGFQDELKLLMVLAFLFIGSAAVYFYLFVRFRKQNRPDKMDYLNAGVQRHLLAVFMIWYGMPKLLGNFFDYQLFALDSPLNAISEFELAWYFYGKNKWQELLAGVMEFVPGLLLLNRKTYYFAALALLPVTSQVFLLNLFFHIGGITFQAAVILLACNLYIVYSRKSSLIQFLRSVAAVPSVSWDKGPRNLLKAGKILMILLAVFIIVMQVKPLLFPSAKQKKYRQLTGAYTLSRSLKNSRPYTPQADSLYYRDIYVEKQSRWNILRRFNNETDAFVLQLNDHNDSLKLYINSGGIGDGKDILDSTTVLSGRYTLSRDMLIIRGIQMGDTVELHYRKRDLKPKDWFWD